MTYPAADLVTERAAVVRQHRSVVPLTAWLADALTRSAADDRELQLVTPPEARLTRALHTALVLPAGRWVVRGDGGCYDGRSGLRLGWDGAAFVPDEDGTTADAFSRVPQGLGTVLTVSLIARHETVDAIGSAVEELTLALAGSRPSGWGPAEPISQPWRRANLAAACQARGELPTLLVVRAGSATGAARTVEATVRVSDGDGVTESVHLAVGLATDDELSPERLGELLGGVAFESMLVSRQAGRADLTVSPHRVGAPEPIALAMGPRLVRAMGRGRAFNPSGLSVRAVGGADPAAWYPLDPLPDHVDGYERLHRLVRFLGGEPVLP
jgi:hypothetical protein